MGGKPRNPKQWRLLSHEAFFKLSTAEKVEYLKAAVEQYGYHADIKPPRSERSPLPRIRRARRG